MSRYFSETFPVGSFQCNCTLLINADTKEAIVVDPGDEAEAILDRLEAHGVEIVRALWHTHAHLDHVGATMFLHDLFSLRNKEKGQPPPHVFLHPEDRWLYEHVDVQSALLGLKPFKVTKHFDPISHGQTYPGFDGARALHTPGHTPGSCCLDVQGVEEIDAPRSFFQGAAMETRNAKAGHKSRVLFSGDTLFRRSIGRTDLWGGDYSKIQTSIKGKLFGLPEGTIVVPGHGPLTTIHEEREQNPFLGERA